MRQTRTGMAAAQKQGKGRDKGHRGFSAAIAGKEKIGWEIRKSPKQKCYSII